MKTKSQKSQLGPREKILRTAVRLFYRQGFPNTGINQIIEESGVAKASFYQWYPSKDDLARAYLDYYGDLLTSRLERLLDRSADIDEFAVRWAAILRRDVRSQGRYNGCPFLNFAAQISAGHEGLDEMPGAIIENWINLVDHRLAKSVSTGQLPPTLDTRLLARRLIHAFSGAHAMWRLTHDPSCIYDLENVFRSLVRDQSLNSTPTR